LLSQAIELIRRQSEDFHAFLSGRKSDRALEDFDAKTERLIGRVFGSASQQLEAYHYAKLGEAAALINLPEEAQESGAQNVDRESLQQRKQVLDCCIAELESRRFRWPVPLIPRFAAATVADYMSRDVRSVHKDATLKEAGRLLSKWKVGSLLVDDNRRYIGIITDTDLSRKGASRGLDPNTTSVKTCMSKPVITIEDSEPLTAAIALMRDKAIRHVAVTEDQTIIGVLSVSDLLRAYAELAGLEGAGAGADDE
jgi:CBS domain-containing protein